MPVQNDTRICVVAKRVAIRNGNWNGGERDGLEIGGMRPITLSWSNY